MLRKLIVFAVTSGLAAKAFNHFRGQRTLQSTRPTGRMDRDAVQRWDDEGGATAAARSDSRA
jgi:hypothetical protein